MAATAPTNDAEAAAMREAVAKYDREQAATKRAETIEFLKPLRELVDSDAFAEVETAARDLTPTYAQHESLDVHLRHLAPFMARLREAVDNMAPPEPAPMPEPAPTE